MMDVILLLHLICHLTFLKIISFQVHHSPMHSPSQLSAHTCILHGTIREELVREGYFTAKTIDLLKKRGVKSS